MYNVHKTRYYGIDFNDQTLGKIMINNKTIFGKWLMSSEFDYNDKYNSNNIISTWFGKSVSTPSFSILFSLPGVLKFHEI